MARKKRSSDAPGAAPKEKFRLAHQLPQKKEPEAYSSGSDSESDEIEDEFGDLATAEIDKGILEIIDAARYDPSKLLDKSKVFFPDVDSSTGAEVQKSKPVYLKDYHRQQLLKGESFESDEDDENKPKVPTYSEEREQERAELLSAVQAQEAGDEDDDDFLVKRKDTDSTAIEELELPDPEKDEDGFLRGFITSGGWIPQDVDRKTGEKVVPRYDEVLEEDNWSEDDLADQYESSYNFRFEDPEAEKVFSYARDQITARRAELSGRKRLREKNRAEKEAEDRKTQAAAAKKKKKVINDVASRMEELLSAVGDEDLARGLAEQDLDGDWDSNEWDKRMLKMFGDDFYQKDEKNFKDSVADHADGNDADPSLDEDITATEEQDMETAEAIAQPAPTKLSKKELRKKAAELVEASKDLLADPESDSQGPKFVYRDVEPESYGLSARDILLADDKQLNSYVGLKHLASYRDQERVARDRRKYAKKRRLREWRRETFQTEEEPSLELWKKMQAEAAEAAAQDMSKKQSASNKKRKNNDRKGKSSKRAKR